MRVHPVHFNHIFFKRKRSFIFPQLRNKFLQSKPLLFAQYIITHCTLQYFHWNINFSTSGRNLSPSTALPKLVSRKSLISSKEYISSIFWDRSQRYPKAYHRPLFLSSLSTSIQLNILFISTLTTSFIWTTSLSSHVSNPRLSSVSTVLSGIFFPCPTLLQDAHHFHHFLLFPYESFALP